MKALFTLLLILLISQYNSESCNSQTKPNKVEDCTERDLDVDDDYKCCKMNYLFTNGTDRTYCQPLIKDEYEKIIEYLQNDVKKKGGNEVVVNATINCSSNYVMVSILSLILLFL